MGSCNSHSTGSSVWKLLRVFKGPWEFGKLGLPDGDPTLKWGLEKVMAAGIEKDKRE
jgi:hypothetical protein